MKNTENSRQGSEISPDVRKLLKQERIRTLTESGSFVIIPQSILSGPGAAEDLPRSVAMSNSSVEKGAVSSGTSREEGSL